MSSPPGVLPSIVMAPAHDPTPAVGTAALFTGVLLSLAYAFISTLHLLMHLSLPPPEPNCRSFFNLKITLLL